MKTIIILTFCVLLAGCDTGEQAVSVSVSEIFEPNSAEAGWVRDIYPNENVRLGRAICKKDNETCLHVGATADESFILTQIVGSSDTTVELLTVQGDIVTFSGPQTFSPGLVVHIGERISAMKNDYEGTPKRVVLVGYFLAR